MAHSFWLLSFVIFLLTPETWFCLHFDSIRVLVFSIGISDFQGNIHIGNALINFIFGNAQRW